MSNSQSVALQADVGNIPTNSVAFLSTLQPLLKAISADNVIPHAVVQLESIGSCFHINGNFAAQVPDLLVRSSSIRLERISQWVGWMAGDTAYTMAQTAGGRAASLLSLVLTELYGADSGEILHRVSQELLLDERNHASISQLGQVALVLSKKMAPIGFGNHLAVQVTRIRETYFSLGQRYPDNLLSKITIDSLVEFLVSLKRALQEELSILYFEGDKGAGLLLAIVMALCPDDVTVRVEDETIFEGQRQQIVLSIKRLDTSSFGIERLLHDEKGNRASHVVSSNYPLAYGVDNLTLKWKGFLAANLDYVLRDAGARPCKKVYSLCAELIAAIIFTMPAKDPGEDLSKLQFTRGHFKFLLGPFAETRIRDILKEILFAEPSIDQPDCYSAYSKLNEHITSLLPSSLCEGPCTICDDRSDSILFYIGDSITPPCVRRNLWDVIWSIIDLGVCATFVTPRQNVCVSFRFFDWRNRAYCVRGLDSGLLNRILKEGKSRANTISKTVAVRSGIGRFFGYKVSQEDDQVLPPVPRYLPPYFVVRKIHEGILQLMRHEPICETEENFMFRRNILGVSSGKCAIFPATLQNPSLSYPLSVEYIMSEGQFHDDRNYYMDLTTFSSGHQQVHHDSLFLTPSTDFPQLGQYLSLLMTTRGKTSSLEIRTEVQLSTRTVGVDFTEVHLGYLGIKYCAGCSHHPRSPPNEHVIRGVRLTDIDNPWTPRSISVTLTHGNPEAQFLCCRGGLPFMIFQANSCINCAITEAKEMGYEVIIQR